MHDLLARAGNVDDRALRPQRAPTAREVRRAFSGRPIQAAGQELALLRGESDLLQREPTGVMALALIGYAAQEWSEHEVTSHQSQSVQPGSARRHLLRVLAGQPGDAQEAARPASDGAATYLLLGLQVSLATSALLTGAERPPRLRALQERLSTWHRWIMAGHTSLQRHHVMELARQNWLPVLPNGTDLRQAARDAGLGRLNYQDRATLLDDAPNLIRRRPELITRADQVLGEDEPGPRGRQASAALLRVCEVLADATQAPWSREVTKRALMLLGFDPAPDMPLPTPRPGGWTWTAQPGSEARQALMGTTQRALQLLATPYREPGTPFVRLPRPSFLIGHLLEEGQPLAGRLLEALLLDDPAQRLGEEQRRAGRREMPALQRPGPEAPAQLQAALTLLAEPSTPPEPHMKDFMTGPDAGRLARRSEAWALIAARRRYTQINGHPLKVDADWPRTLAEVSLAGSCRALLERHPAWLATVDPDRDARWQALTGHLAALSRHLREQA